MENEIETIFEDEDFILINKPSGIVVNKADSQGTNLTIQQWAEDGINKDILIRLKNNSDFLIKEFVSRGGIVHRLDKETSGLLLIAKNPDSFHYLKSQFKEGLVSKTYIALVHGTVTPKEGEVVLPIGRLPWNRMRFGIIPDGRVSETHYNVLEYAVLKDGKKEFPLTLLEAFPKTGRTHQIRVHMQAMGYPIFADPLYAGRKQSRSDRKLLSRHFLHAARISFIPPGKSEKVEYRAKLPHELEQVLQRIGLSFS